MNAWESDYKSHQGNLGLGRAIAYYTTNCIPVLIPLNDTQFIVVVNGDMYEIPSSEITVKSTLTLTDKWDKYKVSL